MEERNNNEETVKIPVSEYKKFLKAQTRLEFLKDYTLRSNYSVSKEDISRLDILRKHLKMISVRKRNGRTRQLSIF